MGDKENRSWNDIISGEEIIISGIAGRFPNSDNMNQLRENLFNKIDLVRDHSRWEIGIKLYLLLYIIFILYCYILLLYLYSCLILHSVKNMLFVCSKSNYIFIC